MTMATFTTEELEDIAAALARIAERNREWSVAGRTARERHWREGRYYGLIDGAKVIRDMIAVKEREIRPRPYLRLVSDEDGAA